MNLPATSELALKQSLGFLLRNYNCWVFFCILLFLIALYILNITLFVVACVFITSSDGQLEANHYPPQFGVSYHFLMGVGLESFSLLTFLNVFFQFGGNICRFFFFDLNSSTF
jgi:hypothetical protein